MAHRVSPKPPDMKHGRRTEHERDEGHRENEVEYRAVVHAERSQRNLLEQRPPSPALILMSDQGIMLMSFVSPRGGSSPDAIATGLAGARISFAEVGFVLKH